MTVWILKGKEVIGKLFDTISKNDGLAKDAFESFFYEIIIKSLKLKKDLIEN